MFLGENTELHVLLCLKKTAMSVTLQRSETAKEAPQLLIFWGVNLFTTNRLTNLLTHFGKKPVSEQDYNGSKVLREAFLLFSLPYLYK